MPADTADVDRAELLRILVSRGGADLHLRAGSAPAMRIDGVLSRHGVDRLDAETIIGIAQELLDPSQQQVLLDTGSVVGAHSEAGIGRFRVTAYRQRNSVALVIHVVPDTIPSLDALGLPAAATHLAGGERGLVLVASGVGHGATTTLAAMVDHVNATRACHVVCVDDPIEILHRDRTGFVSQLEVGADVPSVAHGIRAATRLDADVIAVGDIADRDTAQAALDAVARGRLVLGSIGGHTVLTAVHSFLELFSFEERPIVRDVFARSVAGIIAQRLLPGAPGQVAAVESLVRTAKIGHCLADPARIGEIHGLMEEGDYHGMQTMDQSLASLVKAGRLSAEIALADAVDPEELRITLLR